MTINLITLLFVIAFLCAFIDCATGMGYGTLMSPILLLLQLSIDIIVPVLLLSQLCTGFFACLFHQKIKNINFHPNTTEMKTGFFFILIGSIATIFAVFIVISISKVIAILYIGFNVLIMGIILLFNKNLKFSLKHLYILGGISAFNKSISGGGFGPLITSGQVLSGVELKSAVAITSLAETFLSLLGFILYIVLTNRLDLELSLILIIAGILATPFGVYGAKKVNGKDSRKILGCVIVFLGVLTLIKCFLGFC